MIRQTLMGLAVIAIASGAAAAEPDFTSASNVARTCINNFAVIMEPSGDAPRDVAETAAAMCVRRELEADALIPTVPGVKYGPEELHREYVDLAKAFAVAARLCRLRGNCAPLKILSDPVTLPR